MKPILSVLLIFAFTNSFAQDKLKGNWNAFSFDILKVLQYNFEGPNLSISSLNWQFETQPGTQTASVVRVVESRQKLYYIMRPHADTNIVMLAIFSSVIPDKSFVMGTAPKQQSYFMSVTDALAFIEADTLSRPGLIFYSQKEFERLKLLPDALTISKENYKKYLEGVIEERANFERYASQHKDDFEFGFFFLYLPNQARKILATIGYSPAIDDKHLDQVNDKFKDDPVLKELLEKAFGVE